MRSDTYILTMTLNMKKMCAQSRQENTEMPSALRSSVI